MDSHDQQRTEAAARRGYETRDVNLRAILWLAVSVALLIAGSIVGLWALVNNYMAVAKSTDPPELPIGKPDQTPPAPRLQNTPIRDFEDYRAEQEALLDSYGWVDQEAGVVRIPISRAMELALENGLPQPAPAPLQPEAPADSDSPETTPAPEDNP